MQKALWSIQHTVAQIEQNLQNRSVPASSRILLLFLSFAAFGFRSVIAIRHFFYSVGLFRVKKAPAYTVSVGNITVGGTGKTSMVKKIAHDVNNPLAILVRGYRAKNKRARLVTSPDDGDEAFLLSNRVPFANVFVGKNRTSHLDTAVKMGAKYFLLDDGMQYRKLGRDLEIVMIDGKDPFGGGHILPRGRLRELPSRLKVANYIGIHDAENFQHIKKELEKRTQAKIFGTEYLALDGEKWRGKKVGAFCGIGNPEGFFGILAQLGCYMVKSLQLKDHEPLRKPEKFVQRCQDLGAEVVLCTEKDYVKLSYVDGIEPLQVSLEIVHGQQNYLDMVNEITLGINV